MRCDDAAESDDPPDGDDARAALVLDFSRMDMDALREIAAAEQIPLEALARHFVLDGAERYRLQRAAEAYRAGEVDLATAVERSGTHIAHFLRELRVLGIDAEVDRTRLVADLRVLSASFGDASRMDTLLALLGDD